MGRLFRAYFEGFIVHAIVHGGDVAREEDEHYDPARFCDPVGLDT